MFLVFATLFFALASETLGAECDMAQKTAAGNAIAACSCALTCGLNGGACDCTADYVAATPDCEADGSNLRTAAEAAVAACGGDGGSSSGTGGTGASCALLQAALCASKFAKGCNAVTCTCCAAWSTCLAKAGCAASDAISSTFTQNCGQAPECAANTCDIADTGADQSCSFKLASAIPMNVGSLSACAGGSAELSGDVSFSSVATACANADVAIKQAHQAVVEADATFAHAVTVSDAAVLNVNAKLTAAQIKLEQSSSMILQANAVIQAEATGAIELYGSVYAAGAATIGAATNTIKLADATVAKASDATADAAVTFAAATEFSSTTALETDAMFTGEADVKQDATISVASGTTTTFEDKVMVDGASAMNVDGDVVIKNTVTGWSSVTGAGKVMFKEQAEATISTSSDVGEINVGGESTVTLDSSDAEVVVGNGLVVTDSSSVNVNTPASATSVSIADGKTDASASSTVHVSSDTVTSAAVASGDAATSSGATATSVGAFTSTGTDKAKVGAAAWEVEVGATPPEQILLVDASASGGFSDTSAATSGSVTAMAAGTKRAVLDAEYELEAKDDKLYATKKGGDNNGGGSSTTDGDSSASHATVVLAAALAIVAALV